MLDGANGINGDTEGAIGAVLEANWETQAAGQLTVQLALCCPRSNGADGQKISKELGGNGVQHLTRKRHALGRQVDEQLAGQAQPLVDLEAAINIWVVNQTLPSNCCAGLLEVGSHDNNKLILVLLLGLEQEVAVGEGSLGVMDGARADDDKKPVLLIGLVDNGDDFVTALQNRLLGLWGLGDLMLEQIGWG